MQNGFPSIVNWMSNSNLRAVRGIFQFIQILIEHSESKQWMPCSMASDLALHCLSVSHKNDAMLIWAMFCNVANAGHFGL